MSAPAASTTRYRNGKKVRHDYIVTIRRDHFVDVHATDPADAERRALEEVQKRWGAGSNIEVVSVERE